MDKKSLAKLISEYVDLDESTKRMIGSANYDLYYGPGGQEDEESYPGFSKACDKIRFALSDVPKTLWIPNYATGPEEICENEPAWLNDSYAPDDDVDYPVGEGQSPEEWRKYDYSDILEALVGKELKNYVR